MLTSHWPGTRGDHRRGWERSVRTMSRSWLHRFLAGAIVVLGSAVAEQIGRGAEPAGVIERGRELFERVWEAGDARSAAGDGLGPLFNAKSCVACHRQGGTGGAGANEHNVDLITRVSESLRPEQFIPVVAAAAKDAKGPAADDKVGRLHPELADSPRASGTIVLHRHGVDDAYELRRYELLGLKPPRTPSDAERKRLAMALAQRERRQPAVANYEVAGVTLRRSKRQTPALFGAGAIDRIPDEILRREAALQASRGSDVHGRVAVAQPERPDPFGATRDPRNAPRAMVGRFGWRGQTGSLRQFVLNACANELGLEVPDRHQTLDPLNPQAAAPGIDLDRDACEALVAYVASLPPPGRRTPADEVQQRRVTDGERVFAKIGCAECHVPSLGNVAGIFSDLLLHDLGSGLADPVAAAPANASFFQLAGPDLGEVVPGLPANLLEGAGNIPGGLPGSLQQLASFYSGLASNVPSLQQEWRTPPLWGVADSAPYLHDGRAATLDEAIRLHGGEALRAARGYAGLSNNERQQLLAFLGSLGHD